MKMYIEKKRNQFFLFFMKNFFIKIKYCYLLYMSDRTFVCRGDQIVFQCPYTHKNIILKHEKEGLSLVFESKVIFKKGFDYTEINIGNWKIQESDSGALNFIKNDKILMSLSE